MTDVRRQTASTSTDPVADVAPPRPRPAWRELAASLGREGLRAGATLALCTIVVVGGAVVVVVTWNRTDVASTAVSVWTLVMVAWFVGLLALLGSGVLLWSRFQPSHIGLGVVASGVAALLVGWALRDVTWTVRLPAVWIVLLGAVFLSGALLSAQVGKLWIRAFAATGIVILSALLVTIGRNERVHIAVREADNAYLQLYEIQPPDNAGPAAEPLVDQLCHLAGRQDCSGDGGDGGDDLTCLPGWNLDAFREWTDAASIDREVAATAALARCELRAFDPGSITESSAGGDEVVSDGADRPADSDEAEELVDTEAQTRAAVDARTAVNQALSTQRSEANLVETLADGADGVLSSMSGPNQFAELRFSAATWLVLLGLGLLWYRYLEIRAGGHGLGPVEILTEGDGAAPGDPSGDASPDGHDAAAGDARQVGLAIFKQAVIQNVPEPGAVPGSQALAPVGDLISSTDAPNTWVLSGALDAIRTILATRSGYTVLYSAHTESAPSYPPDGIAPGRTTTSVVFVRIRDTRNGAQKASMRFEADYLEEAAQIAGYWVAGWIISRSRYVPAWAVWSEREAHAFYRLQWRQGDDLPLRVRGLVDPNRIDASVNPLILTQRAYAYQLSPGASGRPDRRGPFIYNALEDFARAAYHQPRYPVARYRRAVALSSLMHEGVRLGDVFLPRSADAGTRELSTSRLLHLFHDLIGFGQGDPGAERILEEWLAELLDTDDMRFPVAMRRAMLHQVDAWFVQDRNAIRASGLARLRPSERRFWHDFRTTNIRNDWIALIDVSRKIIEVRRRYAGEQPGDPQHPWSDMTALERDATRSDSHWQVAYNIGCYYSLRWGLEHDPKDLADAFQWLERCLDRPYSAQLVREWIDRDPELEPIRSSEAGRERWLRWRDRVPLMPVEIALGDRSAAVENLQQLLNQVNRQRADRPQLNVDGYFGEDTARAIREFQYEHRLPVTGKPDYTMLTVLESRSDGPASHAPRTDPLPSGTVDT